MRNTILALSLAALTLAGCSSTATPGQMSAAGTIQPCHHKFRNAQACGNAIFNRTVIEQIQPGQTLTDVRAIMRHDAEQRTVDGSSESWGYMTNSADMTMTWIAFTDQKVTSITQQPWVRE